MLRFPDLVAVVECEDLLHPVEQFLRNQRVMIALVSGPPLTGPIGVAPIP